MNTDNVSNRHQAKVVDCVVVTSDVHNNRDSNRDTKFEKKSTQTPHSLSKVIPEYTDTIKNRVYLINRELALKKSRCRYNVRCERDILLIEMLLLDAHGDITKQYTKEVTPDNYKDILDCMQSGRGFVFDD